jgi:hypothetical protein
MVASQVDENMTDAGLYLVSQESPAQTVGEYNHLPNGLEEGERSCVDPKFVRLEVAKLFVQLPHIVVYNLSLQDDGINAIDALR